MKLLLIDGMALLYRAFYALIRRPLRDSEGRNTSAIFGFAQVLLSLLEREKPTHWAVAFDTEAPTFRHEMDPEYKAHRPPMPEELVPQIAEVKQLLLGMRIPLLLRDGLEADDLMASLALRAAADGADVRLYSSDKDLLQVVDERVKALVPRGPGEEARLTGPAEVRGLWGVGPEHIVDVLALMGDSVDNVPGVKGIGEKTAVKLMHQYGSLEALYQQLDTVLPAGVREKLRAGRDSAFHSRKMVILDTQCDPGMALPQLEVAPFDIPLLTELCRGWEFRRMPLRMMEADPGRAAREARESDPFPDSPETLGPDSGDAGGGPAAAGEARVAAPASSGEHAASVADVAAAFETWCGATTAAADVPGGGGGALGREPEWIFLSDGTRETAIHWQPGSGNGAVRRAAARFFTEGPALVLADARAMAHALRRADLPGPRIQDDLGIAIHLLEMGREEAEELLGEPHDEVPPGGNLTLALDPAPPGPAGVPARLSRWLQRMPALVARLEQRGCLALYRDIEIPLSQVLAGMEEAGVRLDLGVLRDLSRRYGSQMAELEREIHAMAGGEFNINSSKQLAHVLFEKHNLPAGRRTKTGFSTDSSVLEELALTYELPGKVIQYRQLAKLLSTYVDALPGMVNPATGRVHARFHQTVVSTGRLASSDPNMQNIPIRTAEGKEIRRAFVPEPGWRLISADYSQIELRLMAHFSEDPTFLAAFHAGEDIHTRTAAEVFGVPQDEVTPEQRGRAKTINFGLMYGMGAQSLARQLRITLREASEFIGRYFARMPRVAEFRERLLREAREKGYVTTLFGRRVSLPQLKSGDRRLSSQAERVAINAPLQGSAADLIKRAMIDLGAAIRERDLAARLLLQVHDELVLECEAAVTDEVAALARACMERAAELRVPLSASVGAGDNWFEIH